MEATAKLALAVGANPLCAGERLISADQAASVQAGRANDSPSGHQAGVVEVTGERFFGERFEDIPKRIPDVSAIKAAIGFEATTSLMKASAER